MGELFGAKQAAKLLGMRPRTIQDWARHGKLEGIKIGRVWKFKIDDINRLLRVGDSPSPKMKNIPVPLMRLRLDGGNAVTFVETETTRGLLLVAVNGKPVATIKEEELAAAIRTAMASIGAESGIIEPFRM